MTSLTPKEKDAIQRSIKVWEWLRDQVGSEESARYIDSIKAALLDIYNRLGGEDSCAAALAETTESWESTTPPPTG